jgi:hypothetical protein
MSHELPSPLPLYDRKLLRTVAKIVPASERAEWSCVWQAELWHMHHRTRRGRTIASTTDLSIGLTCDALWLRSDSWRRALSGTPALCLGSLLGLCLFAMLIDFAMAGSWGALSPHLRSEFMHFLVAAPLVIFVTLATSSRRHIERIERSSFRKAINRIKRRLFFITEASLVLLLSFLVSVDICEPIHQVAPNTADVLQILFFVILALVGLRWARLDRDQRCEQCLRLLTSPARVGRPSHNLLEWNGTEQVCKQGHGRLSVPEMESSWRESSRWVGQERGWDQAASV